MKKQNQKDKSKANNDKITPGLEGEEAYFQRASKAEIEEGESTTVTRLVYDEYDPSE